LKLGSNHIANHVEQKIDGFRLNMKMLPNNQPEKIIAVLPSNSENFHQLELQEGFPLFRGKYGFYSTLANTDKNSGGSANHTRPPLFSYRIGSY
jgi:hypothetical protein